ncbi:MAG: sugar transferase [Actinomycetes bacterium]
MQLPEPTSKPVDLRRRLIGLDAICITASWSLAFTFGMRSKLIESTAPRLIIEVIALTALGLLLTSIFGLYRSRVSATRSTTIERQVLVALILGSTVWAVERLGHPHPTIMVPAMGTIMLIALLLVMRPCFDAWVTLQRRRGLFNRPVALVGGIAEVEHLADLLSAHPQLGYRAFGYVSETKSTNPCLSHIKWIGNHRNGAEAILESGATGAIIAANGMSSDDLNLMVRTLHNAGVHVHMSSGLSRIGHRRVRQLPMAHEPFFYLEPNRAQPAAMAVKRTLDVFGAVIVLIVTAPITLAAAACIKIQDGGPIFFRQVRIGRHGNQIMIRKLRTMHVDAESRLEELESKNSRTGPLFKIPNDPRVTRVGRWLRASSIDELPQLINVIEGSLSLVGPRPALPDEVAQFDSEHLTRQGIRPGITGLWQVEARHNESFYAYRQLDLFYVENWSPGLDTAILIATILVLIEDTLGSLKRVKTRRRHPSATGQQQRSTVEPFIVDPTDPAQDSMNSNPTDNEQIAPDADLQTPSELTTVTELTTMTG